MIHLKKSVLLASALVLMHGAAIPPGAKTGEARRWFEMKKTADDEGEILIYDEIGASFWNDNAMGAKDFDEELKALGDVKKINLRINSPGGDVFDGIAIHNMIKNHPATVTASIDGIAASIASVIAMAADSIIMPENSFMLIHNASGMAWGNADDMAAMAADLKRIDQSIVATYAARSGQKPAKIQALMKEDRLMDAAEAKDMGFADEIRDAVKLAAKFPLRLLPKAAAEKWKATAESSPEPAPPPVKDGGEPGVSKDGPAPSADNVVKLRADALAEGRAEMRKYVAEVNDLCGLAGRPQMAAKLIADEKSIDEVRAALVKAKADESDQPHVDPHNRDAPVVPPQNLWQKTIDKLNARVTGKK